MSFKFGDVLNSCEHSNGQSHYDKSIEITGVLGFDSRQNVAYFTTSLEASHVSHLHVRCTSCGVALSTTFVCRYMNKC